MPALSTIERYLKKHPAVAEYRFLFECCRAAFAGTQIRYPDGIRPEIFLEIIQHHKLIPHLYPILKSHCENVPNTVLQQFHQLLKHHHLHILKLSSELVRLSKLFSADNIPWLSIKGPALSMQLYGDIAARQSGDLDILVKTDDLDRAISMLIRAGYEIMYSDFIKKGIGKDILLQHTEKDILVELHQKVSYDWLTPDNITSMLWEQPGKIRVGNEEILVPNAASHLTYLYEHGNRHGWYRLAWLWDIALAGNGKFGNDIGRTNLSGEMNRCFLVADILCKDIFGVNNPGISDITRLSGKMKLLVCLSKKAMLYPEKTKSTKMALLRLRYMLHFRIGITGKIKSLKRYLCK